MPRKHEKADIDITRNPIERFLMYFKSYATENRTLVLGGAVALVAVFFIVIISVAVYLHTTDKERVAFEKLNEQLQIYMYDNKIENAESVIEEIKDLTDSSRFGFVNKMGYYYAGNYYYQIGAYEEAKKTLNLFVNRTSRDIFWELAYLKIGIMHKELGDTEKAIDVYSKIEQNYRKGVVLDQLYYYKANAYAELKDYNNARFYYNLVINEFSNSPYASMAQKRLFMLGSW